MYDVKIGVVSTFPKLSSLIMKIAGEMQLDVQLKEGVLEEGVSCAHQLEQEGVDVIVSRGVTYKQIKESSSLPVIAIDITAFDILKALRKANEKGSRIGFMGNIKEFSLEQDSILSFLGDVEVKCYPYNNKQELEVQVEKLVNDDLEVLVSTGSCSFEKVRKSGIHGVLLESGREAVYNSLKKAVEVVREIRRDQEHSEIFRSILELSNDGIIMLDENNRLSFVNTAAEKLLDVNSGSIAGRDAEELSKNSYLTPLFSGNEQEDEFRKIGKRQFWVNKVPVNLKDRERELVMFQSADRIQVLEQKLRHRMFKKGLVAKHNFDDIIGKSDLIGDTINRARKYAGSGATILISGENGTGKELFAQGIHNESDRRKGPFVAVNCAALPENLLESELFGYDEGAFTGARKGGKMGLFEMAHGGTIFLDEIGELTQHVQARLLRVLQEREIMRLGSDRVIPVDVRIIASTNRDLNAAVKEGEFRNDLLYRLEVLDLKVPPLRERKEDIELLADYFIKEFCRESKKDVPPLSVTCIETLKKYNWPGNVRELQNIIEKYVLLYDETETPDSLLTRLVNEKICSKNGVQSSEEPGTVTVKIGKWEDMERQIMQYLLSQGVSVKELTRMLGTSRTTVWRKLKSSGDTAEQYQN